MEKKVSHPDQLKGHYARKRPISRAKIYLIMVVLGIVFLPSFVKYQELSYKNRKMEKKIMMLVSDNRRLEKEKERLETDINYIEKRAREEIGVVRKGEIVMKEATGKK